MLDTKTKESIWTDTEIQQAALQDWIGVLCQLWTAYDKPIDYARLQVYQNVLGKVPLGLLEKAVERCVSEHVYNSVPTVGEVWAAVRKELHGPLDVDQAIAEWEQRRWVRITR